MKQNKHFCQLILLLLLLVFSSLTFAWNRSIELGIGHSHDPNGTRYYNSGLFLSGDFLPLWDSCWYKFTLNATLGQWYTTVPNSKYLTTGAVSLALRLYPNNFEYRPYLLGSVGPAILSSKNFGVNQQGANLAFQCNAGLGIEYKQYDVNLRMAHISNAGLVHPNEGFNVLYVLSVGYLFM